MYFPEANVLVPTTTDPESKTPAFKSVVITVEPDGPPTNGAAGDRAGLRALPVVR
jgi:hypothetical protein